MGTCLDARGEGRGAARAEWPILLVFRRSGCYGKCGRRDTPVRPRTLCIAAPWWSAQLFTAQDPRSTSSNLMGNETLAQVGIALELGIVLAQALTAVAFYRLSPRPSARYG
ncbi:DUF4386 family protein [Microlunatus panaciterrae]|nr:DUF4386 family protein [Microlunatus panaciterrae]